MRIPLFITCVMGGSLVSSSLAQSSGLSPVRDTAGVKTYLLEVLNGVDAAADSFVRHTDEYGAFLKAHGGDYAKAAAAAPAKARELLDAMREDYKALDSFGYERVEGIVAGVNQLADFDVYLDAGVPKEEAGGDSPAAPVVLQLENGGVIEGEGSLFTHIIEPMLWGANPKHTVAVDLNGDGAIAPRESLPKADVLKAAAKDVRKKITELVTKSKEWQPTIEDCFGAITAMTPTLSGYFDDWRESRYEPESSGKFSAVSRVSDMRGIMSSVSVLYDAVHQPVAEQDAALGKSIQQGFKDILAFIDRVEDRERKAAGKLTAAEIEELSAQAKEKADKIVPQVEQAAALLKVDVGT
jgi:hypothetical protein